MVPHVTLGLPRLTVIGFPLLSRTIILNQIPTKCFLQKLMPLAGTRASISYAPHTGEFLTARRADTSQVLLMRNARPYVPSAYRAPIRVASNLLTSRSPLKKASSFSSIIPLFGLQSIAASSCLNTVFTSKRFPVLAGQTIHFLWHLIAQEHALPMLTRLGIAIAKTVSPRRARLRSAHLSPRLSDGTT